MSTHQSINHAISKQLMEQDYTYRRLCEEHDDIETMLDELQMHPSTDRSEMIQLKKMKLKVADRMAKIEREKIQDWH